MLKTTQSLAGEVLLGLLSSIGAGLFISTLLIGAVLLVTG